MRIHKYVILVVLLFTLMGCGSETNPEVENTPPRIVMEADIECRVDFCLIPEIQTWAFGEDDEDGTIPCAFDFSEVDFTVAGSYTAQCTVTDSDGDSATQSVPIVVKENAVPVIVIEPDLPIKFRLGEQPFAYKWVFGEDEEDGVIPCDFDFESVNFDVPGNYTATCTVTDSNGDVATTDFEIDVEDKTPPVVQKMDSHQSNYLVDTAIDFESNILIMDNYDNDLEIDIDDSLVVYDTPGVYDVTYTVTDDAGNETVLVVPYTLIRTTIPVFSEEITSDQSHIWIDYTIIDPDNTFLRLDVEVREDGSLFYVDSFFDIEFEIEIGGLPSDTPFTVTLTYTYDVGGQNGSRQRFREDEILSDSWEIPEFELDLSSQETERIIVDVGVEDVDGRVLESYLELYDGESGTYNEDTLIDTIDVVASEVIPFDGLLTNHSYHYELVYMYDLADGEGIIEVRIPLDVMTDAAPLPFPEIVIAPRRVALIAFEFEMMDTEYIVSNQVEVSIRLNVEGSPVIYSDLFDVFSRPMVEHMVMENFESTYVVSLMYEYDLRDGQGLHMETVEFTYTPISVEIVNIDVSNQPLGIGDPLDAWVFIENLGGHNFLRVYIEELDLEVTVSMMGPDIFVLNLPGYLLDLGTNTFTMGYLVYESVGVEYQIPLDYNNIITFDVYLDPM